MSWPATCMVLENIPAKATRRFGSSMAFSLDSSGKQLTGETFKIEGHCIRVRNGLMFLHLHLMYDLNYRLRQLCQDLSNELWCFLTISNPPANRLRLLDIVYARLLVLVVMLIPSWSLCNSTKPAIFNVGGIP